MLGLRLRVPARQLGERPFESLVLYTPHASLATMGSRRAWASSSRLFPELAHGSF